MQKRKLIMSTERLGSNRRSQMYIRIQTKSVNNEIEFGVLPFYFYLYTHTHTQIKERETNNRWEESTPGADSPDWKKSIKRSCVRSSQPQISLGQPIPLILGARTFNVSQSSTTTPLAIRVMTHRVATDPSRRLFGSPSFYFVIRRVVEGDVPMRTTWLRWLAIRVDCHLVETVICRRKH